VARTDGRATNSSAGVRERRARFLGSFARVLNDDLAYSAALGNSAALEFERELVGRAAAPLHAAQDLVDQATGTFRAQATAFRVASTNPGQLAGLMDRQADLLERAGTLMRDPLTAVRSADNEPPIEDD
jgi:hypothetical protein